MKIIELNYNYRQAVSDGKEVWPEDWDKAKVGEKGVVKIVQHTAQGEGDRWYYDIHMEGGGMIRTFNPCRVIFEPDTK